MSESQRIVASAPGKLLILGEYAVITGSPALVMAVDRRVQVSLAATPGAPACIDAPQLDVHAHRMDWRRAGSDHPEALGPALQFISRLIEGFGARHERLDGLHVVIDSAQLYRPSPGGGGMVKTGLGSSAAVAAALITAFEIYLAGGVDRPDAEARFRRWLPDYRDTLGRNGSGVDLAASLAGGLLRVRPDDATDAIRPMVWPEGLYWQAIWTGQPASSGERVRHFRAWQEHNPAASGALVREMGKVVEELLDDAGNARAWLGAVDRYAALLNRLDARLGGAIWTRSHRSLAEQAARAGVHYKTSGAGGGDLGLAFSHDPGRLKAFAQLVSGPHALPVDLTIAPVGARAD